MKIEKLKKLFLEKYSGCMFLKKPVEVLVTLTTQQFNELNSDLLKSSNPLLLLYEESEYMNPGSVLFTRISLNIGGTSCEFIIEIGDIFEFGLLDKTQEHGDETL